ncbi:MAG: DEAD/DEAH box helicase [Desulfovibrionaceae bacterium]|nr:DEAD/DEAH box helicase [Desulfovibrionaceae bacterium]
MRLVTDLRPHQVKPVERMLPTRVGGLFMDMGTGKTRTALEVIARRQRRIDRVVWFCPVSLKETIEGEVSKHCADVTVAVFNDKTTVRRLPDAFFVVVGLESMSLSRRVILAVNALVTDRTFVVVDESDKIKGFFAQRTKWLIEIGKRARFRMVLTGTPLSQGVTDLFAQMYFLSPKILGYTSWYAFERNHIEYSDRFPGMIRRVHNVEYLAAKVAPYVYQVTKEECLDLPEKLYETRYFGMTGDQQDAYQRAKWDTLFNILSYDNFDQLAIFRLFTALQAVASGYYTSNKDVWFTELLHHRRTSTLLSILEDIPAGEKVIIWGKFQKDMADIVRVLVENYGPEAVAQYHGRFNERRRNQELARFRRDARFLVGTPTAGGRGLTVVEAAYCVFYNNSFKYSERLQAEDRVHRIGQTRAVTYFDIVMRDSIDKKIMEALWAKGNVLSSFREEVSKVRHSKKSLKRLIMSL